MELLVHRLNKTSNFTEGKLYINNEYFCDTLEDKDRGLTSNMPLIDIQKKKIYSKTAIPTGEYKITLDIVSPKFSKYPFYMNICQGKLPRLLDVPGFEGILIHVADGYRGADLVEGCIGIGIKDTEGVLREGKNTFTKLWEKLNLNKEELNITII